MNPRNLQYLVALADERHFGRAAQACGVSQPTLSTAIQRLANDLGVELVEPGSRPVLLTPVAVEIVEQAKTVLADLDTLNRIAAEGGDPTTGELRLGAFPTLAPYLLPRIMPDLQQEFPSIKWQLVEEKTAVLVDRLVLGELDAAILAQPEVHPDLVSAELFTEEFVLAVPGTSDLTRRTTVEVADLQGEEVLLLDEGHCLRDQALSICQQVGATEGGYRATSLETLRQMVAVGAGMTLLPRLATLGPELDQRIRYLEFRSPPARTLGLYWRAGAAKRQLMPQLAKQITAAVAAE